MQSCLKELVYQTDSEDGTTFKVKKKLLHFCDPSQISTNQSWYKIVNPVEKLQNDEEGKYIPTSDKESHWRPSTISEICAIFLIATT